MANDNSLNALANRAPAPSATPTPNPSPAPLAVDDLMQPVRAETPRPTLASLVNAPQNPVPSPQIQQDRQAVGSVLNHLGAAGLDVVSLPGRALLDTLGGASNYVNRGINAAVGSPVLGTQYQSSIVKDGITPFSDLLNQPPAAAPAAPTAKPLPGMPASTPAPVSIAADKPGARPPPGAAGAAFNFPPNTDTLPNGAPDFIARGNAGLQSLANNPALMAQQNDRQQASGSGLLYSLTTGANGKNQVMINGGPPTKPEDPQASADRLAQGQAVAAADKTSLSNAFAQHLASGDWQRAAATANNPAEQAQLGAARQQAQREDAQQRERDGQQSSLNDLLKKLPSANKKELPALQAGIGALSTLLGQNSGQQSADHNSALQHQQAIAKLFGTPQDQQAKTLEMGLKSGQLDMNKTLAALYQQFTQTKNEDQKLHLAGLIHLMRGTNSEKNFQSHVLPEGTEAGPDGQLVKKPGGVVTTDLRNGETKIITQPVPAPAQRGSINGVSGSLIDGKFVPDKKG